jgi:hypothetical protein
MDNAKQNSPGNTMGADQYKWDKSHVQAFWGEIAPADHLVQIYETDRAFLDTLEGFAASGLHAGEAVVIIGTPAHITALNQRLDAQNFNLDELQKNNQYIPLDAEQTLSRFMVNNWPDAGRFRTTISEILTRARGENDRRVRAFGEMVALLWERGLNGATVYLEGLWNDLHKRKGFALYCAYPKTGFTQPLSAAMDMIIKSHQRVIDHKAAPHTEIYYRGT